MSRITNDETKTFLRKMNINAVIPVGGSVSLDESEFQNIENHRRFWSALHTSLDVERSGLFWSVQVFVFLQEADERGSTRTQVQTTAHPRTPPAEAQRSCGVPLSSCEYFDRMLAERSTRFLRKSVKYRRLRPGASTLAKTICSCRSRA